MEPIRTRDGHRKGLETTHWRTKDGPRNSGRYEGTPGKGIPLNNNPQHEDIDLGWEDEMEIEEDNLLTTYNLAEAMSNNVMIEAIQEGLSHPDFKTVLEEYKDIQFKSMKELGRTNIIQHTIQILDKWPIFKGNRPLDQKDQIWIKQELKDLLERGIIRESTSPYSA